ncbi:MAG: Rieske 2Fe-2S domain-containing protein [Acidimicrobiia bacterium]
MARFPFPIPFGWFQVGYPDDVAPGELTPLRYFDSDLVLWRDNSGEIHLQNAICPHLGAHVGYGGCVEGDTIQCPFHGWRFDGAGTCVEVPYSERINKQARLADLPVVERNGLIMAWYHPHGTEPTFDVPVVDDINTDDYTDFYRSSYTIKTAIQEMGENSVDPAHFRYVHGTDEVAECEEYVTDGPTSRMLSAQKYVTPQGVVNGRIDSYATGPGFSEVRFDMPGVVQACLLGCATPIDAETVEQRFNFKVKKTGDERLDSVMADAFVAEINKQLTEDIPIWEHKAHLEKPLLIDTDGPFMAYRKWASQFYAEPVAG